nr:DNA cytosine methyltransferase [Ferrovum sp.]
MLVKYASVCSGIEAASVAWNDLGWTPGWLSEIEPFPSAILAHRFPHVQNLGNMTCIADRIMTGEVFAPDVLVGGTPCQSFSHAGLRAGLSDPRGRLTLEYVRIANAIDAVRSVRGDHPCVTLWENVPGVLSSRDNAFGCFLGALAGEDCDLIPAGKKWTDAGCVFGPTRAVAWRVLDAQHFGVPQRRERVFVVSSAREGFDPAKILFEFEGLRRDSPPRREQRKTFARRVEVSPGASSERTAYGGGNCSGAIDVATTLSAHGGRQDFDPETFIVESECFSLAGNTIGRGRDAGGNGNGFSDICYTLTSNDVHAIAEIIAFDSRQDPVSSTERFGALGSSSPQAQSIVEGSQVRRLTVLECERLQGFPDNWTLVPWRGRMAPDTLRYKAIGNSMSVPVMRWIGQRIAEAL